MEVAKVHQRIQEVTNSATACLRLGNRTMAALNALMTCKGIAGVKAACDAIGAP